MKVAVTAQCATLIQAEKLVQNSENIYELEFSFDESWEGYSKTAIFAVGSSNIAVILVNDKCMIPSQCLKRAGANINIGIYGVRGDQRRPTIWCKTEAILPGAGAGQMVPPPTPDIYAQLFGALGDLSSLQTQGKTLVDAINELKTMIEAGGFTPSPSNPGTTPEPEDPDNTATDDEIGDLLDDIFGSNGNGDLAQQG